MYYIHVFIITENRGRPRFIEEKAKIPSNSSPAHPESGRRGGGTPSSASRRLCPRSSFSGRQQERVTRRGAPGRKNRHRSPGQDVLLRAATALRPLSPSAPVMLIAPATVPTLGGVKLPRERSSPGN